ncbi:MAG: hypothetical protein ACR2KP_15355 [Egibacteraceae bacterium]
MIARFWQRWADGEDRLGALAESDDVLARLAGHADRLTGGLANDRLRRDLLPWSRKLGHLVQAALLACRVLRQSYEGTGEPDGVAADRRRAVEHIDAARMTPHWVAGAELDAFARRCLLLADDDQDDSCTGRVR